MKVDVNEFLKLLKVCNDPDSDRLNKITENGIALIAWCNKYLERHPEPGPNSDELRAIMRGIK